MNPNKYIVFAYYKCGYTIAPRNGPRPSPSIEATSTNVTYFSMSSLKTFVITE
jgi:hypothetical protein